MPGATVSDPNYELPYQYFPGPCQIILYNSHVLMMPLFLCKIYIDPTLMYYKPIEKSQKIFFNQHCGACNKP